MRSAARWGHPKDGPGGKGYTRPFEVLDNVVMTPRNSGHTDETFLGRAADIKANVACLVAGEPLVNVVHVAR